MSLVDRFLRGGKKGGPEVVIGALVAELQDAALGLATRPLDHALVLARLADGLRALGIPPRPAPATVHATSALDDEGWHRLALVVSTLEGSAMRDAWPLVHAALGVGPLVAQMIGAVDEKKLLTLELVRQSEHRAEELARTLVRAVGARVRGETEAQSAAHLERLDYARLLGQADQAKKEAEKRMEELRKLQAMQSAGGRRGKW